MKKTAHLIFREMSWKTVKIRVKMNCDSFWWINPLKRQKWTSGGGKESNVRLWCCAFHLVSSFLCESSPVSDHIQCNECIDRGLFMYLSTTSKPKCVEWFSELCQNLLPSLYLSLHAKRRVKFIVSL